MNLCSRHTVIHLKYMQQTTVMRSLPSGVTHFYLTILINLVQDMSSILSLILITELQSLVIQQLLN